VQGCLSIPQEKRAQAQAKKLKPPNGIKIKEIQKIGREENYLMKLKGKVPRELKGNYKLL